jgi:hypothetical protein
MKIPNKKDINRFNPCEQISCDNCIFYKFFHYKKGENGCKYYTAKPIYLGRGLIRTSADQRNYLYNKYFFQTMLEWYENQ